MTTVYSVTTEFADRADAQALRDIIRELGYEAQVSHRTLETGPRNPVRDTRMGKIILRYMAPVEGSSPKCFHSDDIGAHLETLDYASKSASAALSMLVAQGDVQRVSEGLYRLKQVP